MACLGSDHDKLRATAARRGARRGACRGTCRGACRGGRRGNCLEFPWSCLGIAVGLAADYRGTYQLQWGLPWRAVGLAVGLAMAVIPWLATALVPWFAVASACAATACHQTVKTCISPSYRCRGRPTVADKLDFERQNFDPPPRHHWVGSKKTVRDDDHSEKGRAASTKEAAAACTGRTFILSERVRWLLRRRSPRNAKATDHLLLKMSLHVASFTFVFVMLAIGDRAHFSFSATAHVRQENIELDDDNRMGSSISFVQCAYVNMHYRYAELVPTLPDTAQQLTKSVKLVR